MQNGFALFAREKTREWINSYLKAKLQGELAWIREFDAADPVPADCHPIGAIIDIDASQFDPFDLIETLAGKAAKTAVIAVTRQQSVKKIVRSLQAGAHLVINLLEDPMELEAELEKALARKETQDKGDAFHRERRQKFDFSEIIGHNSSMQHVTESLKRVIRRKWVTVLVRGETGTGKELIARAIHYNSFPESQPFVEINCSALPENLLESELFGYEKGAFTDAKTAKKGLFEVAENGTLFLDEIGDISLNVQVKLLKALEEKRIRRVGGTRDFEIKARIITATNRDLLSAISAGNFRRDLYYRLNVVSLELPPLRERGDDIFLLAHHFLRHYAEEYDSPVRGFSKEAIDVLNSYAWPGNVRELRHAMERLALLSDNAYVSEADLEKTLDAEAGNPVSQRQTGDGVFINIPPEGLSLDEAEKQVISAVLHKTHWNKRQTARMLQISRPRLDRKIERYNLNQP